METNKLSDVKIRAAKPREKTYSMSDGEGMYLEVTPHGGKWWRFKYRYDGKQKRLSLGTYPGTGLKNARKKRQQARDLLLRGIDPAEHRKKEKAATETARRNTFAGVAEEWAAHKVLSEKWTDTTEKKRRGWLENGLLAHIGHRPISEITPAELWETLQRTQQTSGYTANRLRGMASEIFNFAMATGRAENNPALPLQGQLAVKKEKHRLAILEPEQIGELLRAISDCEAMPTIKAAARLAPLVFVRPGELRHAEWAEFDLEKAEWNIPAEKMKMREPHLVPLSRQAVAILRELHALTGDTRYVFEGMRSGKPFSDNTLNKLFRTLGYEGKMTQHGWRAVARTLLDEVLDFRVDWIEHQLAHSVRDANGRAYNRTSHLDGRIRMMQVWADYLDALTVGKAYLTQEAPTENRGLKGASNPQQLQDKDEKNFNTLFAKHAAKLRAG